MKINYRSLKFLVILFLAVYTFPNSVDGQDATMKSLQSDASKTIKEQKIDSGKIWKIGGLFNLNLGQGSQSNWAAGGDDFSISVASYLGLYAFYKKGKDSWDNTLNLNYGVVNTTSLGTRKNDDRIDLLSKYGHAISPKWDVAGLFNFHSQFSKGYSYASDGSKTLLSDFMAPGYLLLSLGFNYRPVKEFSIFISPVTSRWTFVNNDSLTTDYGLTPGNKIKNEIGAFASIMYIGNLNKSKTISYNGRLDLFSNYEHDPQNLDFTMTNMFTTKISKVLNASLGLNFIYDQDITNLGPNHDSKALQFQSILAVGLALKF
jgi:Protein of unknown function (DUF3078)